MRVKMCIRDRKTVDEAVTFLFEYPFMNDVMRVVKEEEPEILEQSYDMDSVSYTHLDVDERQLQCHAEGKRAGFD